MKTSRYLFLFLGLWIVGCTAHPSNIEAVSSHSLDDFVISDQKGEVLGVVDDVIVDSISGEISYAIVTLPSSPYAASLEPMHNTNQVAIPWDFVAIDAGHRAIVLQLDKDVLEDAPRFEKNANGYGIDWDSIILQYWQPFGTGN